MAYAVTADVQKLIHSTRLTIGAGSEPTSTTVTAWIAETDARIDGALKRCGATVPITGTTDLLILRGLVSKKVAALVWKVANPNSAVPEYISDWEEEFKDAFDLMQSCKFKLADQSAAGGAGVALGRTLNEDD